MSTSFGHSLRLLRRPRFGVLGYWASRVVFRGGHVLVESKARDPDRFLAEHGAAYVATTPNDLQLLILPPEINKDPTK
jgi:hypothetical protein